MPGLKLRDESYNHLHRRANVTALSRPCRVEAGLISGDSAASQRLPCASAPGL